MRVFVELAQGPDCLIAQGPRVTLVSKAGDELQSGSESDPTPVTLHGILGYELGWNVACDQSMPPEPFFARIEFAEQATFTMPLGDFGPSCVDGSTGELFMEVDSP